jgi:hypothetical protein
MVRKMSMREIVSRRASGKTSATMDASMAKRHGREVRMRLNRESVIL